MAITSGCLTRIAAWAQLGGFDETLFIDFVDTDYCLRAQRAGWTIAVSAQAQLQHSLGKRSVCQIAGIELRPTNHGPLRRYYIARNRIRMICRHGVHVPHWLVFEVCWTLYNLFRVLVAEKDLWRKFRAEIWGAWHGLRGKTGRAPEPVIRHFES
jgi:rhamnosyltransferase